VTVILASASPRRRELLQRLEIDFEVVPSEVEEQPPEPGASPACYAEMLAREKAAAVSTRRPGDVVLAADTVVAVGVDILGKPRSVEEAVAMLSMLRGRWHAVVTAVAVACSGSLRSGICQAKVHIRDAIEAELREYVATGEPMDKAGAYAIQGRGGRLVDGLEGCFNTVVGLPLSLASELLADCGIVVPNVDCCEFCRLKAGPPRSSVTGSTAPPPEAKDSTSCPNTPPP
jgi:septum formation protein